MQSPCGGRRSVLNGVVNDHRFPGLPNIRRQRLSSSDASSVEMEVAVAVCVPYQRSLQEWLFRSDSQACGRLTRPSAQTRPSSDDNDRGTSLECRLPAQCLQIVSSLDRTLRMNSRQRINALVAHWAKFPIGINDRGVAVTGKYHGHLVCEHAVGSFYELARRSYGLLRSGSRHRRKGGSLVTHSYPEQGDGLARPISDTGFHDTLSDSAGFTALTKLKTHRNGERSMLMSITSNNHHRCDHCRQRCHRRVCRLGYPWLGFAHH